PPGGSVWMPMNFGIACDLPYNSGSDRTVRHQYKGRWSRNGSPGYQATPSSPSWRRGLRRFSVPMLLGPRGALGGDGAGPSIRPVAVPGATGSYRNRGDDTAVSCGVLPFFAESCKRGACGYNRSRFKELTGLLSVLLACLRIRRLSVRI